MGIKGGDFSYEVILLRSKRRETWIVGGCFNHFRGAKVCATSVGDQGNEMKAVDS